MIDEGTGEAPKARICWKLLELCYFVGLFGNTLDLNLKISLTCEKCFSLVYSKYRTCKEFMQNLEIKNDRCDKKTMNLICNMPMPHKCPIPGSCLGGVDANCSAGYTGVLCAVCEKGYSRQFNRCIKCPGPGIAVFQFMGYGAIFIALCFLISWAD